MKKALRILLPILLSVVILVCTVWYLFVYDRGFTRDVLLGMARHSESQGNHTVAAWFYKTAYAQSGNNDAVAIELAQQYKSSGNFTKAEYTLANAIKDGGGVELYIALCNTYVEQDKLLDAVTMLDNITNPQIKDQLSSLRPSAPAASPEPGFYNQYISVNLTSASGTIYASGNGEYPSTQTPAYSEPIMLNDGENTIYAICVGDNGLVSPLAIYGYTVGGVVQPLSFADPAVESSVRELLNVADSKQLYTNDLWDIKEYTVAENAADYSDLKHMSFLEKLTIVSGKSKDMSFLSSLSNLTELSITDTDISEQTLVTIASLPALKKLTLSDCNLASIASLNNAAGLIYLDLNNNTIRNIDALSALTNLSELNLQHNAVTDLSALSTLSGLKKLDVSFNSLTSIAPLSKLAALTWLDAGVNSINDLGQISSLTGLSYLSLKSNQISSVAALSDCTAITDLNISSNALTDISNLSALVNMQYFDFSYNQVKDLPAFPKTAQLVTINGSHNQLTSLEKLGGLENLNRVHMDYNSAISSVKALANCPVLVEVNVYATKVKDIKALSDIGVVVNYKPV